MENNKNKKSVKFQGDMINFCDFIQVFVFTRNHHLKRHFYVLFSIFSVPINHCQIRGEAVIMCVDDQIKMFTSHKTVVQTGKHCN